MNFIYQRGMVHNDYNFKFLLLIIIYIITLIIHIYINIINLIIPTYHS